MKMSNPLLVLDKVHLDDYAVKSRNNRHKLTSSLFHWVNMNIVKV
jgi:hypothetical protein